MSELAGGNCVVIHGRHDMAIHYADFEVESFRALLEMVKEADHVPDTIWEWNSMTDTEQMDSLAKYLAWWFLRIDENVWFEDDEQTVVINWMGGSAHTFRDLRQTICLVAMFCRSPFEWRAFYIEDLDGMPGIISPGEMYFNPTRPNYNSCLKF